MNGAHAELFTYSLYQEMESELLKHSFQIEYYHSSTTDEEPGLGLIKRFRGKEIQFWLELEGGAEAYELYLDDPEVPKPKLKAILMKEGFEKTDDIWTKSVDQKNMKSGGSIT